jgi:DNA-binding transcriptional LysR family regulator
MALPVHLDLDVLRAFVTGLDLGSYARAAERLGRSQSAISLQLRKLEAQTGQQLLRKRGRGLEVTEAGEVMLSYARRLLDLNDEALASVAKHALEGCVRLGLPQGFAETWLPDVLGRFMRAYPRVRVEVKVERNEILLEAIGLRELDLALTWADSAYAKQPFEEVAALPVVWIGSPAFSVDTSKPLPLVLFEHPCVFRSRALAALDAAGMPWRVAFMSPSLSGQWAAVSAGLGVTLRTPDHLPSNLAVLHPTAGLPPLGEIGMWLCFRDDAAASPATLHLHQVLRGTLADFGFAIGLRS